MYNKELKVQFIRSYTKSVNTANIAERIFSAFEEYEEEWGQDLCTQSKDILQPVIDKVTGVRSRSLCMSLTILREYVRWCMDIGIPDACDGMLQITTSEIEKIKTRTVLSPFHLQEYLKKIFDNESEETTDIIYRCYCWMAFSGFAEDSIFLVKTSDVDFNKMLISYDGKEYPLYREAIPAFQVAVKATSFNYKHENPYYETLRMRVPGDTIMRGIRADTSVLTMRTILSRRVSAAVKSRKTDVQLSFYRIWMSGLFYRTYENERMGIPIGFKEASVDFMADKGHVLNATNKNIEFPHRQNQIEKGYMEDYMRWKIAFSL